MGARILLGEDSGGVYGLKVSQEGDDVTNPSEPLIFDSASARSGMVYAGGNDSSAATVDWSATKGTLGYIPLIISIDDGLGSKETYSNDVEVYYEHGQYFESTTTNVTPRGYGGESSSRTAANLKFIVLRLPLQYGKMTDSSLWT